MCLVVRTLHRMVERVKHDEEVPVEYMRKMEDAAMEAGMPVEAFGGRMEQEIVSSKGRL